MDSSDLSSDTFDISRGQWRRDGQDSSGTLNLDQQDEDPSISKKPHSIKELNQVLDLKILTNIIWNDWIRLPHGVWHREGQDSSGNEYEENTDKDPSSPASSTGSGNSFDCDNLPDIDPDPRSRLADGQWHHEGQDSLGHLYEDNQDEDPGQPPLTEESSQDEDPGQPPSTEEPSQDEDLRLPPSTEESSQSFDYDNMQSIYWGPWRQLPNGLWHREGQDTNGNWFQDTQDVEPRQPQSQASLDSVGYEQATMRPQKGKGKHTANPEHLESSDRHNHRRKGLRSSKSDSKRHGDHVKKSRSSKTDVKGKGRESMQFVEMTTADDGVEDAVDDDRIPTSQQILQSIADMYQGGKVGESSSTSTAVAHTGYYAPDSIAEVIDGVPELPSPRYRTLQEGPHYNEDFTQYVTQQSRKFRFGTVFKIIWSEPMGVSRLSRHNKDPVNSGTSISEFGERNYNGTLLYEGIRRFIVVDGVENGARNGNSICVPIASYKRQGCAKHGVKPHYHGIIHTQDRSPMLLPGEPELGYSPVRLVVNSDLQGIERLAPESRINYAKHVTIEHNAPIQIIGQIHPDDLESLESGVDNSWERRVRHRRDKKDKRRPRGKEHTSSRAKEESLQSAETSPKPSERQTPDGMRREDHRPEHSPLEHLESTSRPMPSSPDNDQEKGAKQSNHSPLSQTVRETSTGIHKETQEPHASEDSHVSASDTRELKDAPDSRLESLLISNNVTHTENPHAGGAEVNSTGCLSLPNSPQSLGSSICLTETPSDTTATGQHLTTLQTRQLIVQQSIAYVTFLFQTRTQSRGENTRAHSDHSGDQTRSKAKSSEAANRTTQSSSGVGQSVSTAGKRKASDQPNEEGNDEEKEPPGRASKGKQKEPSAVLLFACPYVKRYGPKAHCKNNGWPSVHRVKEHLYRHHLQPIHCIRCHATFENPAARDSHLLEQKELCVLSDKPLPGGVSTKQEKDLRSREGLSKLNEYEKWQKIYKILFPDAQDQGCSPYFDPRDFLLGINTNKRQKLAQLLEYHVTKELKELKQRHGAGYEPELKADLFKKVVDKALDEDGDEALNETLEEDVNEEVNGEVNEEVNEDEDADVNEACGTHTFSACNEHYNNVGDGVTHPDLSGQSSYQVGTSVGEPYEYPNGLLRPGLFGQYVPLEDYVLGLPQPFQIPNSNDPWAGYGTADPGHQQDTGIGKNTWIDSGIGSSTMSQGYQEWAT